MKNPHALTTPPNPAKEKTTWGTVCQQVGFADNLYKTCRDKLGNDFQPYSPFGDIGELGDPEFEDIDIDKELRGQALAIPKPPPKDWKPEPEGLLEQIMDGSLMNKIMLYGGGAIALWFLYNKYLGDKKPLSGAPMKMLPAPGLAPVAQALHVPLSPKVSDTAPTTVDIPASLRG